LGHLKCNPDLVDGNGNKIEQENIKMFREGYISCYRPSDKLGEAGEWPDALIPFVNPYAPLLDEKHASAFGMPLPWDDVNEYYVFRNHPVRR